MLKLRIFSPCGKSLSILLSFWPCVAALAGASPLWAHQAGGVAASAPQARVVRSVAGAKREQCNGTFVMTRTTFFVPDDREVIAAELLISP